MRDDLGTLAERYHVESSNLSALRPFVRAARGRELASELQEAPSTGRAPILLPSRDAPARVPFEEVIARRRSVRSFADRPLKASALGALCRLGNGIVGSESWRRSAPSSGGLASVDLFPIVLEGCGFPAGIYRYCPAEHGLEVVRAGDFRAWLRERVLLQPELATVPLALSLVCDFRRLSERYGARGYRLGLMDAGHVSENLQLAAAALGLGSCAVGGYVDQEIDQALGLDGIGRASVLLVLMGYPAAA
jgi:SagB-type dehydrogenase family enzyme